MFNGLKYCIVKMFCDRICWFICWGSRCLVFIFCYCLLWCIWWGWSISIIDCLFIVENINKIINLLLFFVDVNFYVSDYIYIFYLLLYFIKKKERNGWFFFGWFNINFLNVYNWCYLGIFDVYV